ncbi:hypothetical protein CY35_01G067500 [Sphagnum magellanicum]|nr:hypothetical protein CY35_01G067500 [Sphagnum magellanicum]
MFCRALETIHSALQQKGSSRLHLKGAMMKYAKNMAAWAACEGIKEVIVLSGLDSGKRQRHDMDLSQIQYISTASKDGLDGRCEALGWKRLEQYLPLSEAWQLLDRDSVTDPVVDNELSPEIHLTDDAYFPGLPFASIFSSCKAEGLKVVCVLCFCAEGDNVPDAFLIADAVQQYLHHGKPEASGAQLEWKVPLSWTTVYGPPPDSTMFS